MKTIRSLLATAKLSASLPFLQRRYEDACAEEKFCKNLSKDNIRWLFHGVAEELLESPKMDSSAILKLTTVPADEFNSASYVDISISLEGGSFASIDSAHLYDIADAELQLIDLVCSDAEVIALLLWELAFYGPASFQEDLDYVINERLKKE